MAEDTQSFQNKKLLVISIVLAIVVVIIYNVHVAAIQNKLAGQRTHLLRYNHDMSRDDKVKRPDVEEVLVPQEVQGALGKFIKAENIEWLLLENNNILQQDVKKNDFVLYTHFEKVQLLKSLDENETAITVSLLPTGSLGNILKVGDKVNLVGFFPIGAGQQAKACRIICGVRVIAIAGKGSTEGNIGGRTDPGQTGYRQIQVAVPTKVGSEDIPLQLQNVMTHAINGGVMVEVDSGPRSGTPTIDKALDPYKNQAAIKSTNG